MTRRQHAVYLALIAAQGAVMSGAMLLVEPLGTGRMVALAALIVLWALVCGVTEGFKEGVERRKDER